MAIPKLNQIYIPESSQEILEGMLTDYRLLVQADLGVEDPAIQPGTELYLRFNAIANAQLAVLANLEIAASQANEQTATGGALDSIREALGLPEVNPAPSSGQVTPQIVGSSPVLFQDGLEFTTPSGLRGQVDGSQTINDGSSINVVMIDTGTATNTASGIKVKWVSPPVNVLQEATVTSSGLTGGTDEESDDEKRARILQRRQNPPAGGNWSQQAEIAEGVSSGIQKAFVYPALGGPGSSKITVCKALESTSYSREVSASIVSDVIAAIETQLPTPFEIVGQSVADEPVDVAIEISLPSAAEGEGWANITPWPLLVSNTKCTVTAVSSTTEITVDADTSTSPVDGTTQIAWWSPDAQTFVIATVSTHSGSSGAWVLTLDTALASGSYSVGTGDYISPAASNLHEYGATWVSELGKLGPGQNTSESCKIANGRSLRHPLVTSSYPSDLTSTQLTALQSTHTEIRDIDWIYRTRTSPSVPASVSDAPNILSPNHLGFYKKA